MLYTLLMVALGGALGACVRYGAGVWITSLWEQPLPLATWAVNLTGCLCIGLLVPMLGRVGLSEAFRFFLIVGFLGSLTTFSTFSLETVALWEKGYHAIALLNLVGSTLLGVLCVWVGLVVGQQVVQYMVR